MTATGIVFDERHSLDPARPHNRESLVWVLSLPEHEVGAVAYTWVDAHGAAGAAGIAFGPQLDGPVFERVDGVPVPESGSFEKWQVQALTISHGGPERDARISYAGERMQLEMQFTPMGVPYAYTSHPKGFPAYFADERLEQGGTGKGTIVLDGQSLEFDGFCHRDHSWGARDWGSCYHYKWLNFLADDTSVHVMDLQGLGRSDIRGYVHRGGETSGIVSATFEYELEAQLVHRALAAELTDSSGRTTRVSMVDSRADITYPIDPSLTLVDVIGAAQIEGVDGVGYVEMAWSPEYLKHGIAVRS
jgi:ribosomal protein L35AE/L33A